jgi:hypothetical protein
MEDLMTYLKNKNTNIKIAKKLLRSNNCFVFSDGYEVFKGRMMDYIKDHLDIEWTDERPGDTDLETGLILLSSEFQRVALFENNIRRIGRRRVFRDYLQGLPSTLSIPFYYYDMRIDLIKLTGCEMIKSLDDDIISDLFYHLIERAVNNLLSMQDMKTLDELDLI